MSEAKVGSTRERFTKEYATAEIAVERKPSLCFHSQNCVALPQVFDDRRRPWVSSPGRMWLRALSAIQRAARGAYLA